MNLTFGFIAFFISVIIPGILFRRFFYYGEFSKQFDSKDPVLHSIFYSIVPGVCIQVICFVIADSLLTFNTSNSDIFNVFKDFVYSGEKAISDSTTNFLDGSLDDFIYYSISVFLISIITGYTLSRIIRWFGLDKKYKILKFKNQWFYIFSGELLNFQKFEVGRSLTTSTSIPHNHKVSMTYADILVDNTEGMRELFSGYVVDYDLCGDNISQLDRIYLLDAYRYKKKVVVENEKNKKKRKKERKIREANMSYTEKLNYDLDYKSRIRLKIPGDVFVVSGKHILNINLTYIPSEIKQAKRKASAQKLYSAISSIYTLLALVLVLVHFIYKWIGLNNTFFEIYSKNSNLFAKIFVILTVLQVFMFLVPTFSKSKNEYSYKNKFFKSRIIALIILYVILVILQYFRALAPEFPIWNPLMLFL